MLFVRLITYFLFTLIAAACAATSPETDVRRSLAPTGKLRVGLISVPVHAIRDPYSGEMRGVSHDLARALAARMGVPFEPIVYPNPTAYVAAGQAGYWDVGSLAVAADRQSMFDFAQPHLEVDYGYLVSASAGIATVGEVDRPGVRVGLVAHSSSDSTLSKGLKRATIVRGRDLTALIDLLNMGDVDVIGAQKTNLYNIAPRVPGCRVLDERAGTEEQAFALPKGRGEAALVYLREFVQHAKTQGLVQRAVDHAGVRGVGVSP